MPPNQLTLFLEIKCTLDETQESFLTECKKSWELKLGAVSSPLGSLALQVIFSSEKIRSAVLLGANMVLRSSDHSLVLKIGLQIQYHLLIGITLLRQLTTQCSIPVDSEPGNSGNSPCRCGGGVGDLKLSMGGLVGGGRGSCRFLLSLSWL